ncbi:MAG: methyl-accepting chemotaxis protein [Deltaproteobacteria bacterium]|nr:methyl-accepting chemotaxis protein [Deltaproteobacteria bacterium]
MRIPVAIKFIFGFLFVVATVASMPLFINLDEEIRVGLATIVGLILGLVFSRSFTKRFTYFIKSAKRISLGDLSFDEKTKPPRILFKDETIDLEDAIELIYTNMRTLVKNLKGSVHNLSTAEQSLSSIVAKGRVTNDEVIAASSKIFAAALDQARHVDSTSALVKDVDSFAEDVADKVNQTASASQMAHSMVERGTATTASAIEKLEGIFTGIDSTTVAASRLKDKLNDIPKILDVITHISRQIDLLALNATIEASKAGEHGKGFAMVAEEVRRFADNTNRSVGDVSTVVKELKDEVEKVVQNVSNSSSFIKEGREDIRKIREILLDVASYTSDMTTRADMIIDLTVKQKEKTHDAVTIIEELARIAQNNLSTSELVDQTVEKHGAATEKTVEAATNLAKIAKELETLVARFKIEEGFDANMSEGQDFPAAAAATAAAAAAATTAFQEPSVTEEAPAYAVTAEEQEAANTAGYTLPDETEAATLPEEEPQDIATFASTEEQAAEEPATEETWVEQPQEYGTEQAASEEYAATEEVPQAEYAAEPNSDLQSEVDTIIEQASGGEAEITAEGFVQEEGQTQEPTFGDFYTESAQSGEDAQAPLIGNIEMEAPPPVPQAGATATAAAARKDDKQRGEFEFEDDDLSGGYFGGKDRA